MFTVHCPRHGTEVLLGSRSIDAIVNGADGPVVHWRCRCGARGTQAMRSTTSHAEPSAGSPAA